MSRFGFLSWRTTRMRVLSVAAGALASLAAPSYAGMVNFGSGANQFGMEFVTIGNPGNAADTTGVPSSAGAVGYTYDIGKFEVSRAMVTAYNANPGVVEITLDPMTGVTGGTGVNKPATGITWNEAARFVNWLNIQKGFAPAYRYTSNTITDNLTPWAPTDLLDYDASNPYRSKRANFFLPSFNEFYKAAFYDPNKSGQGVGGYWNYATGSDSIPSQTTGGTGANTAVYGQTYAQGPADVTNAGGSSKYGVMGLDGNVWDWEESSQDRTNSNGSSNRGLRGGNWRDLTNMGSSVRDIDQVNDGNEDNGFRVASLNSDAVVPEPSMMVIGTLFGLGGLAAKRRRKK